MSGIRKIASDLDGAYWNSNNNRSRRTDENRAMFYENRETVVASPLPQRSHPHSFPRPVVEPTTVDQREILHQLKLLNENIQQIALNQQRSADSWQRYLQHFEENISELRHMIHFQQTEAPMQEEQVPVAISTPFVKQEDEQDVAQTLLSLGERQVCQSLHGFQTSDAQNYYWVAHDAKTRNVLPINDCDSHSIEVSYQNLVRFGAHDHGIPHSCRVGDVLINFDSREGSVGNAWVHFARIKK